MNNKLSQNFNVASLLKFTAPTTIMLVFMSLYQMVDAVFVSNFVNTNALSALNIVFPIPSIIIGVSIMLATGGGAVIARNMGEGKSREAKENFSMIVTVGLIIGAAITTLGIIFIDPIIRTLGATDVLYDYCYDYLFILTLTSTLAIFQMLFQTFFVTAGKPYIGLVLTVIGGVSNIIFDYVFIVICKLEVSGAALGTSIGYAIPAIFGVVYFTVKRKGTLYFVKPKLRIRVLIKSCANGSSEMVTNLAIAITTYMFNVIMLEFLGEDGVAAITIVLYAQFLLTSVFMGFSGGVAPVFGYNYGSGNHKQIKKIFKISIGFILIASLVVFAVSEFFQKPIIAVFTPVDSEVFGITRHGFTLFSISFIFNGFNIFASSLFTAFSNGKVSAVISFLRTFVFLILSLILLPKLIGVDGAWLAIPVAEAAAFFVSVYYFVKMRKVYKYF